MRLTGFLLLLLGALQLSSYGQEISTVYQQYTVEDGLQSNTMNFLFQDSKGYIWLLGDYKAIRFNGSDYKEFNLNSFPIKMWEDEKGKLWISTIHYLYVLEDEKLKAPAPYYKDIFKKMRSSYVHSIGRDLEGNVYFTVDNNSGQGNPGESLFTTAFKIGKDSLETIHLPDDEAAVRLGRLSYLKILDSGDLIYTGRTYNSQFRKNKEEIFHQTFQPELIKQPISNLIRLDDGSFLANTVLELIHFDLDSVYYYGRNIISSNIRCLVKDSKGNIWMGTQEGLWKASQNDIPGIQKVSEIPDFSITSILEDLESNIWLSTQGSGLIKFMGNGLERIHWEEDNLQNQTRDIIHYNDELWISNEGGTLQIINKEKEIRSFPIPNKGGGYYMTRAGDKLLTSHRWLIENNQKRWLGPIKEREGFPREYFRSIYAVDDDKIWTSSRNGAVLISLSQNKVLFDAKKSGFESEIGAMAMAPDESFWVIADGNLHYFDGNSFKPALELYPELKDLQGNMAFLDISFNQEGHMILTLPYSILIKTDQGFQKLQKGKELSGSKYFGANYLEEEKSLWITAFGGLDKFVYDAEAEKYIKEVSLGKYQGLPIQSYGELTVFADKLYLGTPLGIYIIDPETLISTKLPPPQIYISGLETRDSLYTPTESLSLSHDQNNINFIFDLISFQDGEKANIHYRLLGQNEKWELTHNKNLQYSNLAPGKYTLEILASRNGIRPEISPKTLSFEIVPHFTQTLSFQILMGILGALLVGYAVFSAVRWKDRQDRRQRIITELKYQALQSQMSPHFIFNAMNSISFLVKNKKSKEADKYLNKFAGLLRGVLENAQYSFITLLEEIELVQNYLELEQLQFGDQLKIYIDMDPELMAYDLQVPPMLIQPILENAIRHGISPRGYGNLNVNFKNQGDFLKVIIEDDGVGRKYAEELKKQSITHKSRTQVGIKNIYERISVLNNLYGLNMKMEIKDLQNQGKAAGTCVNFTFPKIKYLPEIDNSLLRSFQGLSNAQKEES